MNERIKELAEQAELLIKKTNGDEFRYGYFDPKFQKFAELIIKECANYINERTLDWDADLLWIFNDGSGEMAVDIDDLLNRHFGVDE